MPDATPTLDGLPRGRGEVRLVLQHGLAELVLDNPSARNAVSVGMMRDLQAAIEELRGWSGAVLLLRAGDGQAFCAGGDLAAVRAHLLSRELAAAMSLHMQRCLDALAALPLLRIAVVDGAAVGGGAELLMVADWVVAASGGRVGFVHGSLGVSPGWGGGRRLVARIGSRRARRVLAEARLLPAEECLALGIVDEVIQGPTALPAALALARRVAANPVSAVKAALRVSEGCSVEQEREEFLALWGGAAHRAALARTPQGR